MSLPTDLIKPFTMVAGTDALASYVNANFDFAVDGINDTNTQVNANTGDITALDLAKFDKTAVDTDVALSANSDVKVASQKASKAYVDQLRADTNNALDLKVDDSQLDADPTLAANSDAKIPTQKAVKTLVAATAFTTALPGQAGNNGKVITTDGDNASWTSVKTINGEPILGSNADITTITSPAFTLDAGGEINFASDPGLSSKLRITRLDSTRVLVVISGASTCHGVVWDETAQQYGTPALLRNAATQNRVALHKISDSSVMMVSCTATTALEAVELVISGTTITPGTAATATLAGSIAELRHDAITAHNGSYLVGYSRSSSVVAVRAITVSSGVVTIGDENTQTGTGYWLATIDLGSTAVIFSVYNGGSGFTAKPVTVSGTTITNGTQASLTSNKIEEWQVRFYKLSTGRIGVVYTNTNRFGAIITVTGTTATASTVQLSAAAYDANRYTHLLNDKILNISGNASNAVNINVLTDNDGTAVAGTPLVFTTSGNNWALLGWDDDCVYIALYQSTQLVGVIAKITISGSNPVATVMGSFNAGDSTVCIPAIPFANSNSSTLLVGTKYCGGSVGGAQRLSLLLHRDGSKIMPFKAISPEVSASSLAIESDDAGWSFNQVAGAKIHLQRVRIN